MSLFPTWLPTVSNSDMPNLHGNNQATTAPPPPKKILFLKFLKGLDNASVGAKFLCPSHLTEVQHCSLYEHVFLVTISFKMQKFFFFSLFSSSRVLFRLHAGVHPEDRTAYAIDLSGQNWTGHEVSFCVARWLVLSVHVLLFVTLPKVTRCRDF